MIDAYGNNTILNTTQGTFVKLKLRHLVTAFRRHANTVIVVTDVRWSHTVQLMDYILFVICPEDTQFYTLYNSTIEILQTTCICKQQRSHLPCLQI